VCPGKDASTDNSKNDLWMDFQKSTNRSQKKQPATGYQKRLVKIFTKRRKMGFSFADNCTQKRGAGTLDNQKGEKRRQLR